MNFGYLFKKYRRLQHLTQCEVAERLHICQSNISDWENDVSRPEYEKLIELAKIYDVSVDELLGLKD